MNKTAAKRRRQKEWLFEEQDGKCHYCGKQMFLPKPGEDIKHKDLATFDQGLAGNKVLACSQCNYICNHIKAS